MIDKYTGMHDSWCYIGDCLFYDLGSGKALCPESDGLIVCRELATDSENCGGCGKSCPSDKPLCINSVCTSY